MFSNWPEARPRRGLIITAWQEHIPFDDYLISEAVLFISRPQPDGLNARKVMLPFEQIAAVKFPDVFDLDVFAPVGFQKKFEPQEPTVAAGAAERPRSGAERGGAETVDAPDAKDTGIAEADAATEAPAPQCARTLLSGLEQLEQHVFGPYSEQETQPADAQGPRDAARLLQAEAEQPGENAAPIEIGVAVTDGAVDDKSPGGGDLRSGARGLSDEPEGQ